MRGHGKKILLFSMVFNELVLYFQFSIRYSYIAITNGVRCPGSVEALYLGLKKQRVFGILVSNKIY